MKGKMKKTERRPLKKKKLKIRLTVDNMAFYGVSRNKINEDFDFYSRFNSRTNDFRIILKQNKNWLKKCEKL